MTPDVDTATACQQPGRAAGVAVRRRTVAQEQLHGQSLSPAPSPYHPYQRLLAVPRAASGGPTPTHPNLPTPSLCTTQEPTLPPPPPSLRNPVPYAVVPRHPNERSQHSLLRPRTVCAICSSTNNARLCSFALPARREDACMHDDMCHDKPLHLLFFVPPAFSQLGFSLRGSRSRARRAHVCASCPRSRCFCICFSW